MKCFGEDNGFKVTKIVVRLRVEGVTKNVKVGHRSRCAKNVIVLVIIFSFELLNLLIEYDLLYVISLPSKNIL